MGQGWRSGRALTTVAALLAAAVAGCVSGSPTRIVLPSGEVLQGQGTTRVNGQFVVRGPRTTCYGSYERTVAGVGLAPGRTDTVTATCSDGARATSRDAFWDSGEAALTFADGKRGRILMGEGAEAR